MGRCDFAQSGPPGKVFSHARQSQYHEGRLSPSARIGMSDNGRRGEEGPGTGVIVKVHLGPAMFIGMNNFSFLI